MSATKKHPLRKIATDTVPYLLKGQMAGDGSYLIKNKQNEMYSLFDKIINDPVTKTVSDTETEAAGLHWMADAAYNKSN